VWVTGLLTALPLAAALRGGLLEIARARLAAEGQGEKQAALYEYASGKAFRQRVEAVVEAAAMILQELHKERTALERQWASREQHVHGLVRAVAGLYGDVDGIVGGSLQRIPRLELEPPKAA